MNKDPNEDVQFHAAIGGTLGNLGTNTKNMCTSERKKILQSRSHELRSLAAP